MLHRTLNLGILAHVDAGKTSLTERLLYAAGVIDEIGRVDDGSTQTDTLALERQRGITIKSAVVSFVIDDVTVNLIDTPGHPDFIAEVERVLTVLDGAVLVLSAVEGVQSQTRILMRALQRLRVPTLLFVNKIDRRGADPTRVLTTIAQRLTPSIIAMGAAHDPGTRAARFTPFGTGDASLTAAIAEHDDALLAAYVEGDSIAWTRLRAVLGAQTRGALVHPVFFGSAITGAGVDALGAGIAELLPSAERSADGPATGRVFKVDRGAGGEKIAYVRMFAGTLQTRDRIDFGRDGEQKVTAIRVFDRGAAVQRPAVEAGEIAQLWGLADVRIGDAIGSARTTSDEHYFAPPTLETVVLPRRPDDRSALHLALTQLAEQDPLISVRRDGDELSVRLYGEVQKEVIEATLADDFGVDVEFRETTTICVERPVATGEAVEILHAPSNPFLATIGLRIDPALPGSGVDVRLDVDPRTTPLYVYKTLGSFAAHMDEYVRGTLREGPHGWEVTDCTVTMTRCTYSVPDGPPSRRGPLSTAADFRKLTPLVVAGALVAAGTVVCEPVHRFRLELPADAVGSALPALVRLHAVPGPPVTRGTTSTIEGDVPAARVHELRQRLPGLTHGEGVVDSWFDRYEPVAGPVPTRPRSRHHPLERDAYLRHVGGGSRP